MSRPLGMFENKAHTFSFAFIQCRGGRFTARRHKTHRRHGIFLASPATRKDGMKKIFSGNFLTAKDVFLLCFFVLILIQIAYGLFTDGQLSTQNNALDAVFRTFAAAIAGYFLSGNFSPSQNGAQAYVIRADASPAAKPQARAIGFSDAESEPALPAVTARTWNGNTVQTYIVAGMGLISLILLLILRNTMPLTNTMIAPVTQLRDFLSSSVGFLAGKRE